MNAVHLHLLLTHAPVLGAIFATVLLAAGVARRSDELKKVALWALVVFAVVAIPLYLTGEAAEEAVEHLPGVSEAAIKTHEDAAKVAFGVILSLGAIALGSLAFLRTLSVPQWFAVSVFVLAVATSGLLVWVANLGGKVRHTEIDAGASSTLRTAPTDHD